MIDFSTIALTTALEKGYGALPQTPRGPCPFYLLEDLSRPLAQAALFRIPTLPKIDFSNIEKALSELDHSSRERVNNKTDMMALVREGSRAEV